MATTNAPTDKPEVAAQTAPAKKTAATKKSALPKMSRRQRFMAAGGAGVILVSSGLGFAGGWIGSAARSHTDKADTQTSRQVISSESQLISAIAKEVGPSVVSVNVTSQETAPTNFFGYGGGTSTQESAGTGFIISADGVVVTNRHVVPAGTTKVNVVLSDGTELSDVEVIGRTSESDSLDVAFLKIKDAKGKKLQPAKLGDSSKMQVGGMVIAIGNALGQFQNTVTTGIISGYGRSVEAGDSSGYSTETLQNLFQTDAAINQGNSGGPLVNANGEVIGINTAVAGNAQNIGFAIPINDVNGLINSVLKTGKLQRPYLGVKYVSITDDYAYQYNLTTKRGAYIVPSQDGSSIVDGSPAAKAGLKEKDIIVKANNTTIDENNSLSSVLGRYQVGQKVTLTIIRDGKEQKVDVMLEAAPSS